MTITIAHGRFIAHKSVPYGAKLRDAGWLLTDGMFSTTDLYRVIPVFEHLHSDIKKVVEATAAQHAAAGALEASEGFTAVIPEGMKLYGFQAADVEYIVNHKDTLLAEDAGLGKAQPKGSKVLTPSGFVNIENIEVGDTVLGGDGKECVVVGRVEHPNLAMKEITFNDGTVTRCCVQHLWRTRKRAADDWQVIPLQSIIDRPSHPWQFPLFEQDFTKDIILPLEPYLLGAILGDGSTCGGSVVLVIGNQDLDILSFCAEQLPSGIKKITTHTAAGCLHWRPVGNRGKRINPLLNAVRALGLAVKGPDKFIPDQYFTASRYQRLALLRGLMDTDGSVYTNSRGSSTSTFSTSSSQLAADVAQLVRSLGGRAKARAYGRKDRTSLSYVVSVFLPKDNPFMCARKSSLWKLPIREKTLTRGIKYIADLPPADGICLEVNSADRTYVTDDYIVTHNSAIMISSCNTIKASKILMLVPSIAKYNMYLKEWPKWNTQDKLSATVVNAKDKWPNTDVIIVNYDLLDRYYKEITAIEWDLLICDESHRIKNKDAKRTKFVLGGTMKLKKEQAELAGLTPSNKRGYYKAQGIRAKKRIFATATPMDRPRDFWTVCEAFDPQGLGSNWMKFHRRYCSAVKNFMGRWDVSGADNLEELGAMMRARFMVRHKAEEVLDLPPLREDLFLLPPVQVILDDEESFVDENLEALLGLARDMGSSASAANKSELLGLVGEAILSNVKFIGKPEYVILFTKFAELREKTGVAKVPYVVEYINEKRDDDKYPIVIFAYHRSVIAALREQYPYAAYIIGGMSSEKRNEQVDSFQHGMVNEIILNIDAGGEAITLTRANHLVFAELDWRGTAMIQARKRIHRISQTRSCRVDYLSAADSFDALLAAKCFEKMKNIKQTLDL